MFLAQVSALSATRRWKPHSTPFGLALLHYGFGF